MRDYGTVSPLFWTGETGRQIKKSQEAVIVALYLMTSPHSNMLGLYYCPIEYISADTGIPLEGASKGLRRVIEAEFCRYSESDGVVWVVNMADHQIKGEIKPSDNRVACFNKEYNKLPKCPFLGDFFDKYSVKLHLENKRENTGKHELKISPFEAPSKPLRSQEQEQEQEQKQEQEQEQEKDVSVVLRQPRPAPDEVRIVFDHWKEIMNHKKARLDDKRRRSIKAMLKVGYTTEDLCRAIDGCRSSSWHMGQNDKGTVYDELTLICRDSAHVDKFIRIAEQPEAFNALSAAGKATAMSAMDWLTEDEAASARN